VIGAENKSEVYFFNCKVRNMNLFYLKRFKIDQSFLYIKGTYS